MCVWCCDARWCIVTYYIARSLPLVSPRSPAAAAVASSSFLSSTLVAVSSNAAGGGGRGRRAAAGAEEEEDWKRGEEASPSRRRRRRAAGRGPGLALPFSSSLLPSLSLPPILSSQLGLRHEIACPSESLYIPVAVNRTVTNCS